MKFSGICVPLLCLSAVIGLAQDRLQEMPGAKSFREARAAASKASPSLIHANGQWISANKYQYDFGGKTRVYDTQTGTSQAVADAPAKPEIAADFNLFGPNPQLARGRQAPSAVATDGTQARYDKGNITLVAKGGKETPITTDGDPAKRIKYGTGSWVYGEELEQREAMGFSADSRYLWYYRFDERQVPDYWVLDHLHDQQDSVNVEAYPKPGKPNPVVDLFVYDTQTGRSSTVPVRPGSFNEDMGHYVFGIFWRPDKSVLVFHRMNRRQNELELCTYSPSTGEVKVVYNEKNSAGWVELGPLNKVAPDPWVLGSGKMLTWSESTGFFNLISIDLDNGGAMPLTHLQSDVGDVVPSPSGDKHIYFTVYDGTQPYQPQLHRIATDGSGEVRLTDPAFSHTVQISPDGKHIVDEYQRADIAPSLQMLDVNGKAEATLGISDPKPYLAGGFLPAELFHFTANDGKTEVYGYLHKPRNFDPNKKYPMLLDVYGGPLPPSWGRPISSWQMSRSATDYGFLVVDVFNRGTQARGRDFRQVYFHNMGGPEIDDFASAVKFLDQRPYVDSTRVGIYGTSYGGYASAMALMRYPDVFAAASSSSMVSDWRNYDTAYTERYMGLMPADKDAYDKSSVLTYAKNLKGWLMLYYGTADDNTHASNVMQMIQRLQGKYFELQTGVDRGHSGLNNDRMMEFFIERLVMTGPR